MPSPRIFVSYRRSDTRDLVKYLVSLLRERFGRANVFVDFEDIPDGVDYPERLRLLVDSCTVMLVIIGPNWLNSRDKDNVLRLTRSDDWVRFEVSRGLSRDIRVIPVLVHNAALPTASELPENLANLAARQRRILSDENFEDDFKALVKVLAGERHPLLTTGQAVLAVIVILGVAIFIGLARPAVIAFLFPSATPTPTMLPTFTSTFTLTPTMIPTDTASATLTATPTETASPSATDTDTATITPSQTLTPSDTATMTASETPTPTKTATAAPSHTDTNNVPSGTNGNVSESTSSENSSEAEMSGASGSTSPPPSSGSTSPSPSSGSTSPPP